MNKPICFKRLSVIILILAMFNGEVMQAQNISKINSPLANGVWRKLNVTLNGVHQVTGADIKNWGWDINSIDPATIKLFGNHGGMMNPENNVARSYNLDEISIQVVDGGDGVLNESDYILFWGEAPHKWKRGVNGYYHEVNLYSDKTIYFMTFGGTAGKRIQALNSSSKTPDNTVRTYDHLSFHELEEHKIYKSGKDYHGEIFQESSSLDFNIAVPNPAPGIPAKLKIKFAGGGATSSVSYQFNGVNIGNVGGLYGSEESGDIRYTESLVQYTPNVNANNLLRIAYSKGGNNSLGYLDYFEMIAKSELVLGNNRIIQNEDIIGKATSEFVMQNGGKTYSFWNISNPWSIQLMNTTVSGSESRFVAENNGGTFRFVSFDGTGLLKPVDEGGVSNQNIAGITPPDMVIIAHPAFWSAANKLAQHRRDHDKLTVEVIAPQTIYNEFSSGIQDITAIRDFMRYLYYRDGGSDLKYLLLFGDASYDYKNRVESNTNFVPTFESDNSNSDVGSYCSDDYYGFLDNSDGLWLSNQRLEISIGRIPVGSEDEANKVVEKLMRYDSPKSFGKWRLGITFLADDMDENWDSAHLFHSESLESTSQTNHPIYNPSKIYMDAYKEVLLGGAGSYPEASNEIDETMNKGTLVFNYIGHGGVAGMAKERVVTVDQIDGWENRYQMPVFVTATCELTSYDNPKEKSAGEHMMLNAVGGPVALLTTTRIVYSGPNFSLNQGVWTNNILADNSFDRIGDIYMRTKNRPSINSNDRRFTLIGDPSMRLAKPKNRILIDTINGHDAAALDTFEALSKVSISGHLELRDGSPWSDFEGLIDVTIFDKPLDEKTLGNGAEGISYDYKHQRSIIYSGKVLAKDGKYAFSFIVPKDINYQVGFGKISLYGHNNIDDAAGVKNDIYIGGAAENPEADELGPQIKLFIDDRTFINGGSTDETPFLIADLFDDHGINLSSSGIGRNIVLTLDKGTDLEQQIIVNDFYTSSPGTFKKGEIGYQMSDLSAGFHTLHLKVWDTYNNSSESSITFHVGKKTEEFKIYTIRSVPNPFSSNPRIIIDHNRPGVDMVIKSQLMNLNGKIVIDHTRNLSAVHQHIEFEMNQGNNWITYLKSGMYILRCTLTTSDGEVKSHTEKIVYAKQ